jgi:hypothetical protein
MKRPEGFISRIAPSVPRSMTQTGNDSTIDAQGVVMALIRTIVRPGTGSGCRLGTFLMRRAAAEV